MFKYFQLEVYTVLEIKVHLQLASTVLMSMMPVNGNVLLPGSSVASEILIFPIITFEIAALKIRSPNSMATVPGFL